ncbi:MAG TPA: hypothetical protein VLX44_19810 [Xanthobacteraceae bacterium]|nr:hypothetical protein [Xanthobacteraceae bacterium]
MCMLRGVALVAIAASCATFTGLAPAAADGCAAKPDGPAPQGQHWYYVLDRATKSQCWHLGRLGLAVPKSASQPTAHSGHRGAPAMAAPVAAAPAPLAPDAVAGEPTETGAAAAPSTAAIAPAAAPSAAVAAQTPATEPSAFAAPMPAEPPTVAAIAIAPEPKIAPTPTIVPSELKIAPPETTPASESHSADTTEPVPQMAAASTPTGALGSAPIALPARAAAGVGEDHSFALIVLASALFILVGPVLGITRLLSKAMVRSQSRRAPGALAVVKGQSGSRIN